MKEFPDIHAHLLRLAARCQGRISTQIYTACEYFFASPILLLFLSVFLFYFILRVDDGQTIMSDATDEMWLTVMNVEELQGR